jgi:hypothetical protein
MTITLDHKSERKQGKHEPRNVLRRKFFIEVDVALMKSVGREVLFAPEIMNLDFIGRSANAT